MKWLLLFVKRLVPEQTRFSNLCRPGRATFGHLCAAQKGVKKQLFTPLPEPVGELLRGAWKDGSRGGVRVSVFIVHIFRI